VVKDYIKKYVDEGYSVYKIAKLFGKGASTIRYWLKKFEFKTKPKSKWYDLPWAKIQIDYDNNGTCKSIQEKYSLNRRCISWGVKNGFLKFRNHKEAMELASKLRRLTGGDWTLEKREAARQRMIARIKENPDNHPNRKLASNRLNMSFPERLVFDYLKSKGIQFEHNKYVKPYWLDFCIGKIIIEVDGKRWHDFKKDAVRDKDLESKGYKVFRFDSKKIVKDVSVIDGVINQLAK
jgi:very-short-patch-repair endonuclease